ncbi:NAD-P-binding protein [Rhizoctonia solani]|uniref:NAD-P-binding protein n=1 Tax=Rhizoctonia solani TaxID=456999 RepID=A0A8H7IM09_9AGAM|nr:NAD-P-binding protein [Rhizoctonia solani]
MGNTFSQGFPPKPIFTVEQIPELTGQVMIVTEGIPELGKKLVKLVSSITGALAPSQASHLANFASIRKAVEEFKSKETELHVLFNNAGVMVPPVEQRTTEGYDLQFGTNVLGHYLFTTLLLPMLIHTAKNSPLAHGHARVINTSSSAVYHVPKGGIIWETLGIDASSVQACKTLGTHKLYYQSKLGNVLFSNELARRYASQGIISSSLNPGNLQTDLVRHLNWFVVGLLGFFLHPASYGALTQLWSGTTVDGESHSGKFLIPWDRVGTLGHIAMIKSLLKGYGIG